MTTPERQQRRQRITLALEAIILVFLVLIVVEGPSYINRIDRNQERRTEIFVRTSKETNALICDAYRQLRIEPPRRTCLDVPPPQTAPVQP